MVVQVGDVHVAGTIDSDIDGVTDLCLRGRPTIAGDARFPVAHHGADDLGDGIDATHAAGIDFRDEEIAAPVKGQTYRAAKTRKSHDGAVRWESRGSRVTEWCNRAVRSYTKNPAFITRGVDVPVAIGSNANGLNS